MNAPVRYPVPWDLVFGLTPHLRARTRTNINAFTRSIVERMHPAPVFEGLEHLPDDHRFVLTANHYQREGLWILHTAGAITQAVVHRYGAPDETADGAPVRWMVTANWPRLRLGKFEVPNPGDIFLKRVAYSLSCYPIAFAGSDPAFTAQSLRQILRDARTLRWPLGLFPEGAAASAGKLNPALPGIDRFLPKLRLPAVPCGVREDGRMFLRFGPPIARAEIESAPDAGALVMERISRLLQ